MDKTFLQMFAKLEDMSFYIILTEIKIRNESSQSETYWSSALTSASSLLLMLVYYEFMLKLDA